MDIKKALKATKEKTQIILINKGWIDSRFLINKRCQRPRKDFFPVLGVGGGGEGENPEIYIRLNDHSRGRAE